MIATPAFLALGIIAQEPVPALSASEILDTVEGLHKKYTSVSFIYEGTKAKVDRGGAKDGETERFQGFLAYRPHDACLWDVYQRTDVPDFPFYRTVYAVCGKRLERYSYNFDNPPPRKPYIYSKDFRNPPVASINTTDIPPHRFLRLWFFPFLKRLKGLDLRVEGWEEVGGFSCLRIYIDDAKDSKAPRKRTERYWIDLRRDGHVLRSEQYINGRRHSVLHDVELKEYPLPDGGTAWLPVSAVISTYGSPLDPGDRVTTRVKHGVLAGTVKINEPLPDALFSVRSQLKKSAPASLRFAAEFEEESKKVKPIEFAIDPDSVRDRLTEQVAAADRAGPMFDAAESARREARVALWIQGVLVGTGAVLILVGVVVLRRGGGR